MFLYYSCYMSFFALTSRTRHTQLGVGGVRGAGCFSVSLLLRAHSVASTTCAVLASGGVRRHMGSDTLQHVPLIALSGKVGQSPLTQNRLHKPFKNGVVSVLSCSTRKIPD